MNDDMEQYRNSQEANENRDALHPEWPAQYVVVNEEKGAVVWCESHTGAVTQAGCYGGVVLNTETCPRQVVEAALQAARKNMNLKQQ